MSKDEQFDEDISKFDTSFNQYFNNVGGASIEISYDDNKLHIMDEHQACKATLSIGRSAKQAGLNLSDMLKTNLKIGDKQYGVLFNGFDNKNWLFAVDIVDII